MHMHIVRFKLSEILIHLNDKKNCIATMHIQNNGRRTRIGRGFLFNFNYRHHSFIIRWLRNF